MTWTDPRTAAYTPTKGPIDVEPTIAESSFSHVINAPIERVDIADWLFHLTNAEYQRCCPPAHITCGATTTDDGRPMSTNVELIGENQQYVGEITDPDHCRMVS